MKTIGLIDDRDNQRLAFKRKLDLIIEERYSDWQIQDIRPFENKEDYRPWILENEISLLILDERLDESKSSDNKHVGYYGSDLVKELRESFKDFPIYCITSYEISESLKNSLNYFNLTLNRSRFDDDIDNYLNSFIRSGTSFYNEFQSELSRLGELSSKVATSQANSEDLEELQSLQTRLAIPHVSETIISKEIYLERVEESIDAIKAIQKELIEYLNRK